MAPFYCNAASSRSKFVRFETAEICFDLYSIIFWGIKCSQYKGIQLVHSVSPSVHEHCIPFLQFQHQSESQHGVPCTYLHPKVFPNALLRFGLPGGTVTSFFRFLGVPLFGVETRRRCTPFWRSPLFSRTRPEILLSETPRRFGSATAQTKNRTHTIS